MNCTKIRYEFTSRKDGYVIVTAIFEYDSKYLVKYNVEFVDDGHEDNYYFERAKKLVWDQANTGYLDTCAYKLTKEERELELEKKPIKIEVESVEISDKKEKQKSSIPMPSFVKWWLNRKLWIRLSTYSVISIGIVLACVLTLLQGSVTYVSGGGSSDFNIFSASVEDTSLTPAEAAAVSMSDAEVVEGEDFNTTINIDDTVIENKVLPATLDYVYASGASKQNKLLAASNSNTTNEDIDIKDQCEYVVSEDMIHADLRVPANYANGNIRVGMTLAESEKVTLKIWGSDYTYGKGWFIDPTSGEKTETLEDVSVRTNEEVSSPSCFYLNETFVDKRYECAWQNYEGSVYYAKFIEFPKYYTVTFNPGEGSFKTAADAELAMQTIKYGEKITNVPELAEPATLGELEYIGYRWYTDKDFTNRFDPENMPVTDNINLTAKWIYKTDYIELTSLEDGNILEFKVLSGSNYTIESSYTADPEDWTPHPGANHFTSEPMEESEKVYVRVKPNGGTPTISIPTISSTGKFNVSGNIMSLIDCTQPLTDLGSSDFKYLFGYAGESDGAKVVDATGLMLPATNITAEAYKGMFKNCKELTGAPDMSNVVSTGEKSCEEMFMNCKNLEAGPVVLGATTVGPYSYSNMFAGCTKLIATPEIKATTFEGGTTISEIAANCYSMFAGCTKLIATQDTLPALSLKSQSYSNMFKDCTSLKKAPKIAATTYTSYSCWSMFYNCTALTDVPDLLLTTVGTNCCDSMFYGCSHLQKAPYLPATTLPNDSACYNMMFMFCSSLNEMKIAYTGPFPDYAMQGSPTCNWVAYHYTPTIGDFYYNGSDIKYNDSAIPLGWDVHTFTP